MVASDPPSVDAREAVEDVLDGHPVRTAVLFGSRVRGDETGWSDVDLVVEFDETLSQTDRHRARLELIVDLMDALETDDVDVSDLSTIRPAVGVSALRTGVVLRGNQERIEHLLAAFESRVSARSHEERMQAFDELIDRLEETV